MPARFNDTSNHGRLLGAKSAKKAGEARMASLSPKQKIQHQTMAANARWSKKGTKSHEIPRRTNG